MADFKISRIRFRWAGDWSASQNYIKDDIVRPNISAEYRCNPEFGRRSYALVEGGEIKAVVCIANGFSIPTNETELSKIPYYSAENNQVFMVPYTIWSYSSGYGRILLNGLLENVRKEIKRTNQQKPRIVTMSPKTKVASRFHLSNGAVLIADNEESYNFEYKI